MAGEKGFDVPDNGKLLQGDGSLTLPWSQWIARVHRFVNAGQQSGTTAQRPTSGLWVGRFYFDTTLGTPIWLESLNPTVWVNASGTPV